MRIVLVLLMGIICLKAFPQCASQTVIPDSAFDGKYLATANSCLSYPLNLPFVANEIVYYQH